MFGKMAKKREMGARERVVGIVRLRGWMGEHQQ
jgi:hypothetical protein